ncbi:hypothetical protein KKB18_04355, partial [bacterium]|nr:hypothetical protein [bacterium]
MALNLKLDVRLEQKLVLTPSLQQAIKLLQLNRIELIQEIHQELLQNPTIEESNSDSDHNSNSDDDTDFKKSDHTTNPDDDEIPEIPNPTEEVEWEKYFQDYYESEKFNQNYNSSNFVPADNFVNKKSSLPEHLLWQLGLAHLSEDDVEVASKIIGYIDDEGYLLLNDDDIAQECGIS